MECVVRTHEDALARILVISCPDGKVKATDPSTKGLHSDA